MSTRGYLVLIGALALTIAAGCSASPEVATGQVTPTPTLAPTQAAATAVPQPTPTVVVVPTVAVNNSIMASFLLVDPDPAAIDDSLAALERIKTEAEIVVGADLSGCELVEVRAVPHPREIVVEAVLDSRVQCVRAVEFRALFLVPRTSFNRHGRWNYEDAPAITVNYIDL